MKYFNLLILFYCCFLWSSSLESNELKTNIIAKRIYITKQIEGNQIIIDGNFSESAWKEVPWSSNFIQNHPMEGSKPSQKTKFKILYDRHNLYVAIRAYDSHHDLIDKRLSRRDNISGDFVEIDIDSYFDHMTAFVFITSVAEIKSDGIISDDGKEFDLNWNPVWFCKSQCDNQGWKVEMKIPLSQLRFHDLPEQIWGLQLTRYLFRKDEQSNWQYFSRDKSGMVSRFGELHGLKRLKSQRQVELLPYVLGKLSHYSPEEGSPFATGKTTELNYGLDGKIGVTANFTLDFTVNPDFGQVEADPAVLNLSEFETFYSEKRPFFVEGANIFKFNVTNPYMGSYFTMDSLFYSRRIGHPPSLSFSSDSSADYFADNPENTTILGAFKFSGKSYNGFSLGIMESITAEENAEIIDRGVKYKEAVEPMTNWLVSRFQKDFNDGATQFGGMFTAVNRNISDDDLDFLRKEAYSCGIDFLHKWHDNFYFIGGNFVLSEIKGSEDAIYQTQTSSTHYFQRTDASYLHLDDTKTSMLGNGGTISGGISTESPLRFETGYSWRSPNLELNDIGYLRSADIMDTWAWIGYFVNKPTKFTNFYHFTGKFLNEQDYGGNTLFNNVLITAFSELKSLWDLSFNLNYSWQKLSNDLLRGGPAFKLPDTLGLNFYFGYDPHNKFQSGIGINYNKGQNDLSSFHSIFYELSYHPTDNFDFSITSSYSISKNKLEYVASTERDLVTYKDGGNSVNYILANINQPSFSVSVRADYIISPDLSIQFYCQPAIFAGKYSSYKEIIDPRASNYYEQVRIYSDDAVDWTLDGYITVDNDGDGKPNFQFDNPNFKSNFFTSNLVIRWEFKPGSTLFLVWSQGRNNYLSTGHFEAVKDIKGMFSIQPENIYMMKLNYWFSF